MFSANDCQSGENGVPVELVRGTASQPASRPSGLARSSGAHSSPAVEFPMQIVAALLNALLMITTVIIDSSHSRREGEQQPRRQHLDTPFSGAPISGAT